MSEDTLFPDEKDVTREAQIRIVQSLADQTDNPSFANACKSFLEAYLPGDKVIEFCSSKQTWRNGFGRAGFQLIRSDEVIATLLTKIN